jgi:phosphoribosylanthranilate isomerase
MSIVHAVGSQISTVGVFVDSPVETISKVADQLELDFVQLHGDQPVEWLGQLAPRRVIRAVRLAPGQDGLVEELWRAAERLGTPPAAILVDAYHEGSFGGTGKRVDWGQVKEIGNLVSGCPLILAGGLNPENVFDAIRRSGCGVVDVASGVETAPGRKGLLKMRQFVARALAAFDA